MLVWFAAAFCAFFIKGLCGFANTLVFTSILSFGTANFEITPVELLLGFPSNVFLSWRGKKRLLPRLILPLAVLLLAGNAAGAFLLKSVDPGPLKIFFGLAVIAVGRRCSCGKNARKRKKSRRLWVGSQGCSRASCAACSAWAPCWRPISAGSPTTARP